MTWRRSNSLGPILGTSECASSNIGRPDLKHTGFRQKERQLSLVPTLNGVRTSCLMPMFVVPGHALPRLDKHHEVGPALAQLPHGDGGDSKAMWFEIVGDFCD